MFTYALLHFLNIGLGLVSSDLMHAAQDLRQIITRSMPGTVLIYGAFVTHMILVLSKLALRGTLRMPIWEAVQVCLGLMIPVLLMAHLVHTRTAHEIFAVKDEMGYISLLLYNTLDGWKQALLLLIVWVHGCMGLHFWLRGKAWWRRMLPGLMGSATLIPAFALAGFLIEGRRITARFTRPEQRSALLDAYNFPDSETFATLIVWTRYMGWGLLVIMAFVVLVYLIKSALSHRQSVRVSYLDGPDVWAPKGLTLLEVSRLRGVPHASLCGGRGRCTTCRVIVSKGTAQLHGFTARTTGQLPYDVVFLLNRFFDAIVPAINAEGGTIDKYLGDGLLAIFEAPTPERSAHAALRAIEGVARALDRFNDALAREHQGPVAIGIGAHLGNVVLGEIGAVGQAPRTLIGDTVNAASRLEGVTKEHAVQAMISAQLLCCAGHAPSAEHMVSLSLRGVHAPLAALPVKDARTLGAQLRALSEMRLA